MSFRFVEPRTRVGNGIDNFAGSKLFFFEFGDPATAKVTFSDSALSSENTDPVIADPDGLFGDIFTDTKGTVTLKTSADVVVWGPIDFFAPEDGITALAASAVSVLDTAGNFTATNVETVLAEISDNFLKLSRANTISAIQTFTAALQMADNALRRPLLLDYSIESAGKSSSAGTLTLDLTLANSFVTTLTENTTVSIINPPVTGTYGQFVIKIIQDGAGGAFTVTWPSSVIWPSGGAPTISIANNAIDEITLRTIDAGTEWRGSFSQAFA